MPIRAWRTDLLHLQVILRMTWLAAKTMLLAKRKEWRLNIPASHLQWKRRVSRGLCAVSAAVWGETAGVIEACLSLRCWFTSSGGLQTSAFVTLNHGLSGSLSHLDFNYLLNCGWGPRGKEIEHGPCTCQSAIPTSHNRKRGNSHEIYMWMSRYVILEIIKVFANLCRGFGTNFA